MSDIIARKTSVFKPRKNHLFGEPVSYGKLVSYLNGNSWDVDEHNTLFKNSGVAYTIKLDDNGNDTTISIYNEKSNIIEIEKLLSCKYYENGKSNEMFFSLPYQKLVEYLEELETQLPVKNNILERYEALIDNTFAKELYALTNTDACELKQVGSVYKLVKDDSPVITPFVRLAIPGDVTNVNVFISMRGVPIILKHTYITNGVHIYQYPQYLLDNYDSIYNSIDFMYIEGLSSKENVYCTISSMDMYSQEHDSNGVLFGLNTVK